MSLRLPARKLCLPSSRPLLTLPSTRLAPFSHGTVKREEKAEDPRLKDEVGDLVIEDQYAILREKYGVLQ